LKEVAACRERGCKFLYEERYALGPLIEIRGEARRGISGSSTGVTEVKAQ